MGHDTNANEHPIRIRHDRNRANPQRNARDRTQRAAAFQTGLAALIAAAGLLGPGSAALAQPQSPVVQIEVDRPQILVPQRWLTSPDLAEAVMVQTVDAKVEIRGRLATTTLTMELSNPSSRMAEAVLLLPVPEGASISAFGLNNGELKGEVLPIDEARRIYTEIVRRLVDPGLLEFVGTGAVRSSVFPVPAQGTQTVTLTYAHVLTGHGNRIDFELPRSQDPAAAQASWSIEVSVQPVERAGRMQGHSEAFAAWSPSHEIETEPAGKGLRVRVRNGNEPGPFRLSVIDANAGDPITAVSYPDSENPSAGGHVAFFLAAPQHTARHNPIPREVTVVIDRSGSMRGEKLEQAKAAALQVLEALSPGERFTVIDYADDVKRFAASPVEKTPASIEALREYIAEIQAVGGTNIHDALLDAVRPEPAEGTLPIVLFLTDGLATTGVTGEAAIRDAVANANTHERRIYTFGVGPDLNAALLSTVATATRGTPTFVRPGESTEVKVGELFAKLAGPVLASLSMDSGGRLADALPAAGDLPDLFAGSTQIVLARYTGDAPFTATIRGTGRDGEIVSYDATVDPRQANSVSAIAVPRLWAQRRVAGLIAQIREAGADGPIDPNNPRIKELIGDIVHLSRRYGILTEYTAFLAAEKEELAAVPDFTDAMGRFAPPASANEAAAELILNRAAAGRVGDNAVRQSQALESQRSTINVMRSDDATANAYAFSAGTGAVTSELATQTATRIVSRVQNIADQTLFNQSGRWIDARLVRDTLADDADATPPDETVAFGSERYSEILTVLVGQGRQALLANRGEIELLFEGRRVLIQNPG